MRREIFREYDIRGIADKDLTAETVELLGKGIGTWLRRKGCAKIALGRDCRLSSEPFRNAILKGLTATGMAVTDIGCVPTPLLYYAIHELGRDGGIMITGSHNPADYNGFKICLGNSSVHGEQIQEIADLIEAQDFEKGAGDVSAADVMDSYKKCLLGIIKLPRRVRVAMDCGNGTACLLAPDIADALGCDVTRLYCDMDGNFPNHHPDPTIVENLADLRKTVTSNGLELGISFDGDADRIGVVADDGRIVWGDMLLAIYAREILRRKPSATFIAEVKCSMNLYDDIEKHGGRAIMWRTGHSLIKAKMKEEKAEMAGEMSGHMFFADRYLGYDDAIYAACRIIELLADSPVPLSEILDSFPATFVTPEIRFQCDDDKKFLVVEKVKEYFQKDYKVIDVDGARVLFPDGWGLIRASNTQDVLVMRFEAATEARLDEIRAMVEKKAVEVKNNF
ncbi:MAG: phosphomannomutase/phosphoglucomutase [Acidobacteria bacterium]|nr:phosphomannomutase/phosphoglucomutase [Acidobacteriota bacterium]